MPFYDFYCEDCEETFEVRKGMNDPNPEECETCNGKNIYRCYQNDNVSGIIDASQPKTIGELAHKNTEKMVKNGSLGKSSLDYESNNKKIKSERARASKIAKFSKKQKTEYVLTGKVNGNKI